MVLRCCVHPRHNLAHQRIVIQILAREKLKGILPGLERLV